MSQFSNYFKFLDVAKEILEERNEKKLSDAERIARRPRPEQFEAVEPPIPPTQWCDNDLFTAGYPAGWFETTPTEPPIEGSPAVLVLRRNPVTGMPDDLESRGVIRCFRMTDRATEDEFLDVANGMAEVRGRSLRATVVDPERFLSVDGAYCYAFQVQGTLQIRPFQTVPSAITEAHLFHLNQVFMMQLESAPQHHEDYRQALGTVLGTLHWK
jgi:hypothetical protein